MYKLEMESPGGVFLQNKVPFYLGLVVWNAKWEYTSSLWSYIFHHESTIFASWSCIVQIMERHINYGTP